MSEAHIAAPCAKIRACVMPLRVAAAWRYELRATLRAACYGPTRTATRRRVGTVWHAAQPARASHVARQSGRASCSPPCSARHPARAGDGGPTRTPRPAAATHARGAYAGGGSVDAEHAPPLERDAIDLAVAQKLRPIHNTHEYTRSLGRSVGLDRRRRPTASADGIGRRRCRGAATRIGGRRSQRGQASRRRAAVRAPPGRNRRIRYNSAARYYHYSVARRRAGERKCAKSKTTAKSKPTAKKQNDGQKRT